MVKITQENSNPLKKSEKRRERCEIAQNSELYRVLEDISCLSCQGLLTRVFTEFLKTPGAGEHVEENDKETLTGSGLEPRTS